MILRQCYLTVCEVHSSPQSASKYTRGAPLQNVMQGCNTNLSKQTRLHTTRIIFTQNTPLTNRFCIFSSVTTAQVSNFNEHVVFLIN